MRLTWSVTMENSGARAPSFAEVSRKLKTIKPIKIAVSAPSKARKMLFVFTFPMWFTPAGRKMPRAPFKLLVNTSIQRP